MTGKSDKRKNRRQLRMPLVIMVLCLAMALLSGCGEKLVFTAGSVGDVVFAVGDETVPVSELKVYFVNLQKEYEALYGADVWTRQGNENTGAGVRDNALARLARVKVLDLMAARDGVALTDTQLQSAADAGGAYWASLNDAEKSYFGISEEGLISMYEDYALAEDEYAHILSQVDPEVSDDEARSVTCQYIYLAAADDALERAQAIRQEIFDGIANLTGVTFEEYIAKYSESSQQTMSISRADSDAALSAAAFMLGLNEISDPVEAQDGCYILKCISLSDEAQTDENKAVILKRRQDSAFSEAYGDFVAQLDYGIDESSVGRLTPVTDENITTASFFTTYAEYFGENDS